MSIYQGRLDVEGVYMYIYIYIWHPQMNYSIYIYMHTCIMLGCEPYMEVIPRVRLDAEPESAGVDHGDPYEDGF